MEKRKIVFASANPGKIREASEILGDGFEILSAAEAGVTEDIPETGNTLRDNSLQKASYIYEKTGMDCFADDTGLEVDILGGAPGVHTARYAGEGKDFNANISKLLIARERSGNGGFGYDPVFIPDGCNGLTAAEIPEEEKNAISHRGKSLRAMAAFLNSL